MWLLSKYRRLRRKQQYRQYNRIHQTNIRSDDASLKACYGNGVSIADTVIVSSDVTIGKYSYVNPHSTLENCTVGNYCSISAGVNICPGEHDLYAISTHPLFARDEMPKRAPVVIGHDVLISLNAVILKNVHIGNGAVIGAGAVVTKDVEPYEIVGGVPAKHIGWRFDPETRERIEQCRWWEKEPNEIKVIAKDKHVIKDGNRLNARTST